MKKNNNITDERFLTHNELCYSRNLKKINETTYQPITICSRVPVVDNEGRVVYVSKNSIVDNREKFQNLRVTDFGISNLIAVGADKNLSSVSMTSDSFTDIANMERTISSIEKHGNNSQPSVEPIDNNIVEPLNN